MTSYSLDVKLFISEVKKYPELWNNNNEDSTPARRHQAWTEIARIIVEDFDELVVLERNEVYKKLQGKWRNIRDSFVRHKRRNYGVTKKGYRYAKDLTFLEETYKQTGYSGSDFDANHEDTNQNDDAWQSDVDDETKLKRMLFKDEPLVWVNEDETPRKRKRSSQRDTQIDFVETNFPEATCTYGTEDEDRAFFLSLLPAVRDFDIDKKLEFRSDVIKIIKQYRKDGRSILRDESDC